MIVLRGTGNCRNNDIAIDDLPYPLGRKENDLARLAEGNESFAEGLSFLSRKHAVIYTQDSRMLIRDEGSLNGTEVNGKPVGEQGTVLHNGDNLILSGKLFFIFENTSEITAGNTLKLEMCRDSGESKQLEFTQFPVVIGESSAESSFVDLGCSDIFHARPGNVLRISLDNGTFFLEDLGSGIHVRLDGKSFTKGKERFEEGGILEIASRIKITFPSAGLEVKASGEEKTTVNTMLMGKHDGVPPDQTVYMESPTQFIKVVTADEGDGADGADNENGQGGMVRSKSFPVKAVVYAVLFVAFLVSIWGGVHFYTQRGLPKAEDLFEKGENMAALSLVQEKLEKKPDYKAAANLLFKIVAREYMTEYAERLLQKDLSGARAALAKSIEYERYSSKIQRFNTLLQLFLELSEAVPDPDDFSVRIDWAEKYTSLHGNWTKDMMENRSILEELVAVDPIFLDLRKDVYAKMNGLKLIVNRKVPAIKTFHEKLREYLDNNTPENIRSLLTAEPLLEGITGMHEYQSDLERYLNFDRAVDDHDAEALLGILENPGLNSEIFRQYYKERIKTQIPPPEVLAVVSDAESAWDEGQSKKAIALLRGVNGAQWQASISSRLSHMEAVSEAYEKLVSQRSNPDYPRALMQFRNILDVGMDSFYEIYSAREAEKAKKTLQAEYDALFSQFKKRWEQYKRAGGITTMQRMENSISETFVQQAGRLMAAYTAYKESRTLADSFQLAASVDMAELGKKLREEVIFQRQMISDLQMVLGREVYEGKIKLLPAQEM